MKTLILAGGKGTRLWPLSRELMPKQFIKLFENSSLFQKTVERALIFSKPEEVFIVANREYKFRILDDLEEIGIEIPKENIFLEPMAKSTLPAIFWVLKSNSGKFAVLPSDHLLEVNEEYKKAFSSAEKLADNYLVTFGIKPTKAHTGYGYIKPGKAVGDGFIVDQFKEKPDLETAKRYVESGYYWNSGMFLFDSDLFREEVKKLAPDIFKAFDNSEKIDEIYKKIPEISVDYGILEKSKRVAVVPLATKWSDLGSFDSLYDVLKKDENGNAIVGEKPLSFESRNNLIVAQKLIAMIGVEDLILVDTDDALLISKLGKSEKVKELHKVLSKRGDKRAVIHRTAYRPWGTYTLLEEGERYKIKRITIKPGKRLSLQRHYHRSEHWVVVKGTARVVFDNKEILLRPGESTFIPAGVIHRLENPGKVDLEVIETQIGEYLEEDDIERIEDDYGR
ncbi:MAG: mannose-1-phosphate guanylyltransferase/mannose-6-phosphate isomerase [Archaeoglobaceae archaeon]|nr:mannose-1-phosphate guanylyltransferase/mannose-6-phosphate isomerase [Archaeoglobaceae archaeon]MDW8127939.1 mannose-1-phosphate guanylyltransferase/mannose-6-phosphate isomerase [Archaeoglobaceae archaeon]